jgi:chitin synthase
VPRIPLHPRDSFDSFLSNTTGINSVYMPRRVESIMGDEDRKKYFYAQQAQRESSTSYNDERSRGRLRSGG